MKTTVTQDMFVKTLWSKPPYFTRLALVAIYDELLAMEREEGQEYDLKVSEVCEHFHEWFSVVKCARSHGMPWDAEDKEADMGLIAREWLDDQPNLKILDVEGGNIVVFYPSAL